MMFPTSLVYIPMCLKCSVFCWKLCDYFAYYIAHLVFSLLVFY